MADTPVFAITRLNDQQVGAEDSHNQALARLEQLVGAQIIDRDLTAPPGSPAEGDAYIVGGSATGAWSGHDGHLAYWAAGQWYFITPKVGWPVFLVDEDTVVRWNGTYWVAEEGVAVLTDAATIDWNTHKGAHCMVTVTNNRTLGTPTALRKGKRYSIAIRQDGTGSRLITWPALVKWVGSAAPTLTTTADKVDIFAFVYNGTNLLEVSRGLNVG